MSTVIEEPRSSSSESAQYLRRSTAAVRLAISWFGVRKSLSRDQKAQAAASFDAAGEFLSAGKKLLDTSHPAYKAVTGVRNRIVSYWKGMSLPFPEPGIRLIRQDNVDGFNRHLNWLRDELSAAVTTLDEQYSELRSAARERLGSLYNASDYPESLNGLFDVSWDFPSVEPPPYLQRLNPELYEAECQRVRARFDEAVQLAEEAFAEELAKLVSHLAERLSGSDDGQPKVFRDSAVENLTEFFERFRHLSVGSNEELDRLVDDVQQLMQGIEPRQLRRSDTLRGQVRLELGKTQRALDDLLVNRPRRNIVRRAK